MKWINFPFDKKILNLDHVEQIIDCMSEYGGDTRPYQIRFYINTENDDYHSASYENSEWRDRDYKFIELLLGNSSLSMVKLLGNQCS